MSRKNDVIQGLLYGSVLGASLFGLATLSLSQALLGLLLGALAGLVPAWRQLLDLTSRPGAWDTAGNCGELGFYLGFVLGALGGLMSTVGIFGAMFIGLIAGILVGGVTFSLGAIWTFLRWLGAHVRR